MCDHTLSHIDVFITLFHTKLTSQKTDEATPGRSRKLSTESRGETATATANDPEAPVALGRRGLPLAAVANPRLPAPFNIGVKTAETPAIGVS